MSLRGFLNRKAKESTHNTILAYLTIVLGAVFLVGGLIGTTFMLKSSNWLLLFPLQQLSHPTNPIGIILTIPGFFLVSVGFVLALYYDRKRTWYLNQLEEHWKSPKKILEEYDRGLKRPPT